MLEPVTQYLRRLRRQLTLLYLLAALALVFLIGVGSYGLLQYYFQYTTDLALEYKLAGIYQQYGFELPETLNQAEQNWLAGLPGRDELSMPEVNNHEAEDEEEGKDEEDDHSSDEEEDPPSDEAYDGQLAAVFFLPFDGQGQPLLSGPSGLLPAVTQPALAAAGQNGSDRRTVRLPDGRRVRLLTYRSPGSSGPAFFLVGRLLADQDRVVGLYLMGLVGLGSGMVLFLWLGGWWLSGRNLSPAQKAWDQQQAFVANASHELRAPLTLIRATADYGLRSGAVETSRQSLVEIVQECDYMSRLVNDLLLLSRLDAGRLAVDCQSIELSSFLPEIVSQAQKIALEKGISLSLETPHGTVYADPTRLRQILWILLDNAFRYTPAGQQVQVGALLVGRGMDIYVKDSGAGIPAQHLPHVIERFYQASQPSPDSGRSNGLGLSIGRALVEAQHGKIAISSQVGQGTCVRVWLPAKP